MLSNLVCVVDDDESVRESLRALLASAGYRVIAFSSPEACLESDARRGAGCLVADVRMPRMSGPDLYAEIVRRGEALPVVFITGQPTDEIRARVRDARAVALLVKPFDDEALLDAIEQALVPPS
ncbi:response regulator transcription factor [Sandaracinus amylolyticus]|uniref:Nitrogen regulation protein NR(I) n=1 Tax=Sandaracinus amylolyticus TaxID=927083 RepID=A0A0F6W0J7_9BACT|nr:response regulator [Sandaracinus amylolyticus]AKF04406.1 Nitrogen regulation protein NR(I) [Sandaracinus amylolyticus]